jgi:hypothetical protein
MRRTLALLIVVTSLLPAARAARACGAGGVTTHADTTIAADAQRIFISVHDGVTDIVTQIGVPATTADYGVVIPVAAEPTLDPTPVMSSELDVLFSATAPSILVQTGDGGGGCGCPLATGSNKGGGGAPTRGGTQVSEPVTIGPVTAVTLTADTGDAINAWLADNGFAISPADQPIVAAYAATGRYFIALRRNDSAADGGGSSVGLHFTLPGDQRGLPLRFSRIGSAATVGFTVLVAADDYVAPASPFATLTLNNLVAETLRRSGYAVAVSDAVAQHGGHAFVVEGTWTDADLARDRIDSLRPYIPTGAHLTRLSTLMPATALDTDAFLDQPLTRAAPRQIYVERTTPAHAPPRLAIGAGLLATAVMVRRRARR